MENFFFMYFNIVNCEWILIELCDYWIMNYFFFLLLICECREDYIFLLRSLFINEIIINEDLCFFFLSLCIVLYIYCIFKI